MRNNFANDIKQKQRQLFFPTHKASGLTRSDTSENLFHAQVDMTNEYSIPLKIALFTMFFHSL